MVARYLLVRLAEKYGYIINFHPKPLYKVSPMINGSGCHCNFSTELMRGENGNDYILDCINKLEKKHELFIKNYGKDNELRLSGKCETSNINTFSYGYLTRNTSIRINKNYLEDRRPASNCDPYLVTSLIFSSVI